MNTSQLYKRLLEIITHEFFISGLGLVAFALLIWCIGPLIAIGDKFPLESIVNRLLIILLIVFVWLVNKLGKRKSIETSEQPSTQLPLLIQEEISLVKNNCQALISYLTHDHLTKEGSRPSLNQLQWYLTLGPMGAGKTTLLSNTELGLKSITPLTKHSLENNMAMSHCNGWVNDQSVILDIPGRYLKNDLTDPDNLELWPSLIHLLNNELPTQKIHGLIVTLSLTELLGQSKTQFQQDIRLIKQRILELTKQLPEGFPIHIVLTKIDLLSGFNEFFSGLTGADRQQIWGVNFSNKNYQTYSQNFTEEYDALLKRLHQQLISRLNSERHIQKRSLISEFPLQMETLKNLLTDLVYQLADIAVYREKVKVSGIYFCSATQGGAPVDRLLQAMNTSFSLQPYRFGKSVINPKPYFIKQLFTDTVFNYKASSYAYAVDTKTTWLRRLTYLGATSTVIASTIFWSNNFNKNIGVLNAAHDAVIEYRILTPHLIQNNATAPLEHNVTQMLASLNSLQKASQSLQEISAFGPFNLASRQENKLRKTINDVYQQALHVILMPALHDVLEQQLQNKNSTDPNFLYNTLAAYLMFSDPRHFNAMFIKNWFDSYTKQTSSNNINRSLQIHLANITLMTSTPLAQNDALISQVRDKLNHMPYAELAYLILKNNTVSTKTQDVLTTMNNQEMALPSIYTATQLQKIYFSGIEATCHSMLQGNWILGTPLNASLSKKELNELIKNVRELYLRDYSNWWKNTTTLLNIAPINTLSQDIQVLNNLTSRASPFLHTIQAINDNTALSRLLPPSDTIDNADTLLIKQTISDKFSNISELSKLLNSGGAVQVNLAKLRDYLMIIQDSNDSVKASFIAASHHMENASDDPLNILEAQASQLTEPLKTWLSTLATQSWKLILSGAQTHMESIWQTKVVSEYNNNLKNRYPLFAQESAEISLNDFSHFFAPGGTLDDYFDKYIRPFIETAQGHWRFKTVGGMTFQIPQTVLGQFERAAIIQRSFFALGNQQASLRFSLEPLSLEPTIKEITLNINSQRVTTLPDTMQTHHLAWPGQGEEVSITFENINGQRITLHEAGPWALFKLLDKAHIQPTIKPTQFILNFTIEGYTAAKYALIATQRANPFGPDLLQQFRCPSQLLG